MNTKVFFNATIVWDDQKPIEENYTTVRFCSLDDSDRLLPEHGYTDEDVFHYGLTYEEVKNLVGKECKETCEDFKVIELHD